MTAPLQRSEAANPRRAVADPTQVFDFACRQPDEQRLEGRS